MPQRDKSRSTDLSWYLHPPVPVTDLQHYTFRNQVPTCN